MFATSCDRAYHSLSGVREQADRVDYRGTLCHFPTVKHTHASAPPSCVFDRESELCLIYPSLITTTTITHPLLRSTTVFISRTDPRSLPCNCNCNCTCYCAVRGREGPPAPFKQANLGPGTRTWVNWHRVCWGCVNCDWFWCRSGLTGATQTRALGSHLPLSHLDPCLLAVLLLSRPRQEPD